MAKSSLRGKLLGHFQSAMATIADPAAFGGQKSGQLTGQSAARFADQVLAIVRAHDEDYARTLDLAAAFRRLPVQITVNEATAPFADGCLTDESVAMLAAAAERDFAARQRDAGWGGDRDPEPVDAGIPDPEVAAMAAIVAAMDALDGETILLGTDVHERVIRWAMARYLGPVSG